MAVKVESLSGTPVGIPVFRPQPRPAPGLMSREQRVAQVRRRRRLARFQGAVESALWIGGAGLATSVCLAGLFGLR